MGENIPVTGPTLPSESSGDISSTTDFIMPVEEVPQITQKRRLELMDLDGEPPLKKKSRQTILLDAGFQWNLQALSEAATAVQSGGKSPVSALNELGLKVNYTVVHQGGPSHCPSFTIAVNIADMKFEGWGHSKREARAAAARTCLTALLARVGRSLPTNKDADFTSDEYAKVADFNTQLNETPRARPAPSAARMESAALPSLPRKTDQSLHPLFGPATPLKIPKNPINVLYENYPGISFQVTFGDGTSLEDTQGPTTTLSHSMRFKVVCQIKDHKFEAYGSSKKLAKLAAAKSALAALDGEPVDSPRDSTGSTPTGTAPQGDGFPQTLSDLIGKLVNEKFNEMMKDDVIHAKRKVLAGIVITQNLSLKGARVIAVTTGTKCVSGEHMSVRGMAVNDCHAEVAARRCLQKHIYSQLLMYAQAKDPRKPIEDNDLEPVPSGGYRLKPSLDVHLYISTAPCGDGRIFSPHEAQNNTEDKHPNRSARGLLRTKIESGEGTIPVKNSTNVIQTWDGVLQGERLLTMSCSDKVARWCVVGLQGALLSLLVKPIYLRSIVLGSLLHYHHMYRAICGRYEGTLYGLPPNFMLRRPQIARCHSAEVRCPQRAPNFSVCWCASHHPEPEILNATTGKLENGQPSLLCKQSMFARWQYLATRVTPVKQELEPGMSPVTIPANLENILYSEAKQLCTPYQLAKTRLMEAFEKAKLGRWIKKPLEQDQFVCELTNADPKALFA